MKKLRLDFDNRIVSMVSDQKTVIAYMDEGLRKKDFQPFFPSEAAYNSTDNVTFDFENRLLCLKQPAVRSADAKNGVEGYRCVQRIEMPSIREDLRRLMKIVGWNKG